MIGLESKSARLGAMVLLGFVLFNPPLIEIFDAGATRMVAGIPLLYFYLFFSWAALIFLMALIIERSSRGVGDRPAASGKGDRRAAD